VIKETDFLYIEPREQATSTPLIDALTRKMAAAFRLGVESLYSTKGFHLCRCGAASSNCDYQLPNGEWTNSLCVHYLAHHRSEVPQAQLDKVAALTYGEAEPNENELRSPKEMHQTKSGKIEIRGR
jgi:hypothetical protein